MKDIFEAIDANNLVTVKESIRDGIDINTKDSEGNTPLMLAAKKGYCDIVKFLIEKNADLSMRNSGGQSALTLAKVRRNKEITKLLIAKIAIDKQYIEAKLDEDIRIIINKLITTLLYKSMRHTWDSSICEELRAMICDLNNVFSGFSKEAYIGYIRKQETSHREFYGSYLSDDSDSDEEHKYGLLSDERKRALTQEARTYRHRAQIEEVFYQKETNKNKRGDLKNIDTGSKVFDLPERTRVYNFPNHIPPNNIQRDLDHLNILIARGVSVEYAQKEVSTIFYVAQYRGITHLTSKWNKSSRKAHRIENEIAKAQYSAAIYQSEGIDLYRNFSAAQTKLIEQKDSVTQRAEALKQLLLTLREYIPCTYNGYSYSSMANLLQNIYSQDYDGFHRFLQEQEFFRNLLAQTNPFISMGDVPYHALKYSYGIKPYKGHENERLRPRWKISGKAERPYSGVTYVSLHPFTDYGMDGPLNVVSLNRAAEIKLQEELIIVAERESAFPGFLPQDRVIHKHIAKYPSFKGKYKEIYLHKYGIDKYFYEKLMEKFRGARPHTPEMTEFKKILGEWLCSYQEVKLIEIARQEAEKRGGILVYQDLNGHFAFAPPVDSVNRNTRKITGDIKLPVKNKQALRRVLAYPIKEEIRLMVENNDVTRAFKNNHAQQCDYYGIEDFQITDDVSYQARILYFLLLNAMDNKRYLALKELVKHPFCAEALTICANSYSLKNVSLLHLAVENNDKEIVEILLSCPNIEISYCDESTNEQWHDFTFYENISPLALSIIHGNEEMFMLLLKSNLFCLDEKISYVTNKDLINDGMLYENPDKDHWDVGLGWCAREAYPITRTKNNSLLHLAARHGTLNMVRELLAAGIVRDSQNDNFLTPEKVALEYNKDEIASLLKENKKEKSIPLYKFFTAKNNKNGYLPPKQNTAVTNNKKYKSKSIHDFFSVTTKPTTKELSSRLLEAGPSQRPLA